MMAGRPEQGDWVCTGCRTFNFKRHPVCFECNEPKGRLIVKAWDRVCMACGDLVFARSDQCRCGAQVRHLHPAVAVREHRERSRDREEVRKEHVGPTVRLSMKRKEEGQQGDPEEEEGQREAPPGAIIRRCRSCGWETFKPVVSRCKAQGCGDVVPGAGIRGYTEDGDKVLYDSWPWVKKPFRINPCVWVKNLKRAKVQGCWAAVVTESVWRQAQQVVQVKVQLLGGPAELEDGGFLPKILTLMSSDCDRPGRDSERVMKEIWRKGARVPMVRMGFESDALVKAGELGEANDPQEGAMVTKEGKGIVRVMLKPGRGNSFEEVVLDGEEEEGQGQPDGAPGEEGETEQLEEQESEEGQVEVDLETMRAEEKMHWAEVHKTLCWARRRELKTGLNTLTELSAIAAWHQTRLAMLRRGQRVEPNDRKQFLQLKQQLADMQNAAEVG